MGAPSLTDAQRREALGMMDGKTSDAKIAKAFGVSDQVIGRLRRKHGIVPASPSGMYFQPTEEQIAELHETSDREMHRRYGVWKETWRKVRKRYGIPQFRPPTVINGEPNSWVEKPEKKTWKNDWGFNSPPPIPPRDHSLAGEAAAFLQRERFHVFNREKLGLGEGWQCGYTSLTPSELIAKAERLGFQREEWMV